MDGMKNNTAGLAEQAGENMEEAPDLVLKLKKPYVFDGQTYTEVDLSGLEDTTAADLAAVGKIVTKLGVVSPMPEMSMEFCLHMAARVSGMKVDFFTGLPAGEAIKLKNIVTGFLYGGDGDN
uniref:Tail assembly protein n=1 Tax=Dulem virus 34 TaxID=3145752 RepID=A0AAU8B7C8_9CAUD